MATPQTMNAISIAAPGPPDVLRLETRPVPEVLSGHVLIRIHAAGVNRPDVLQRLGRYDPPPGVTDIPGLEVAGQIVKLGEGVSGLKVGDEVCALLAGGGYAEYCSAPAGQCLPLPKGFSMVEAATLPEVFFTVWSNVFETAGLRSGEVFLVHGGASGIGTAAIQMGHVFGARVFATAGSPEKCDLCEQLGAERAINYRSEDFVEVVRNATGGRGVDVVLDMVGGDYIGRSINVMARRGRHVSIAFLQGAKVNLNMFPVMAKQLVLTGSTLRARPNEEKAAIGERLRTNVWPRLEDGSIRPIVHAKFPLARAADAHALMESNQHLGKIALEVLV